MTSVSTPTTIPEVLNWALKAHPHRVAYAHEGSNAPPPMTFEDLAIRVTARTARLPPGFGPVVILLESSPEWSVSCLAVVAQARPAVLLDARLEMAGLLSQLRDARPDALITDDARAAELRENWARECRGEPLPLMLSVDDEESWPGGGRPIAPSAETIAAILYTSGSTGTPKGIQQTHGSLVASALRAGDIAPLRSDDIILSLVPFSHILGFCGVFVSPIFFGASVLFLDSFKPARIMTALRARSVTTLYAPPVLYELMVKRIDEKMQALSRGRSVLARVFLGVSRGLRRLSPRLAARAAGLMFASVHRELGLRLDKLITGGARLAPLAAEKLLALGFDLRQAYGLSETAGVCVCRPFQGRPGSVGPAMAGMTVKINQPNQKGEGEIWVKGDQVMRGYYGHADLTAKVMTDGWFKTGDIGRLNRRRELTIGGRLNDTIVTSNGKKIHPEDLELHFATTPGMAEVCAFGLPTAEGTLIALAATPIMGGGSPSESVAALRRLLEQRNAALPPHRRVQRFFVRAEELPKTTTRKIQRYRLIAELTAPMRPPPTQGGRVD